MEIQIYRRFWLLYFTILGTKAEQLIERMDALAKEIEKGNPQVEYVLNYYEEAFLNVMLDGEVYPPKLRN